jgi:hypothetical protein
LTKESPPGGSFPRPLFENQCFLQFPISNRLLGFNVPKCPGRNKLPLEDFSFPKDDLSHREESLDQRISSKGSFPSPSLLFQGIKPKNSLVEETIFKTLISKRPPFPRPLFKNQHCVHLANVVKSFSNLNAHDSQCIRISPKVSYIPTSQQYPQKFINEKSRYSRNWLGGSLHFMRKYSIL